VAADDLAVGALDLAGTVGVDGQGPAEFVQDDVVVPPAVIFEVGEAGVAAVGSVLDVVGLTAARGLVAAAGMRTRRRRETGDRHAPRLPDTMARLVTFTVTAQTRSGRAKATQIRVLTTLLDHETFPAREIAALYAERWQVEIAFLHLKKTVRGPRRALRGQSPDLARQEAWALLLIHNIVATATARAAAEAGTDPRLIPFTAVLGLVRAHVAADTRCRHCGRRPTRPDAPLDGLTSAIIALPRHRQGRQRTSGRTEAERRTRHTEEVTYTIDITKSNLPKWDTVPET
jgi:hypothetical protein